MEKIKVFIECLVPITSCNLKCEYCYVIQENRRKMEIPKFKYDAKRIGKGLSKKRLGGIAYISICGAGETLIQQEVIDIVYELLKEGHYVNITTNGTLTNRFDYIINNFPKEYLERLHFAFSFHYLELKKLNLLERFTNNILKMKENGCSYVLQLNMYDGYVKYLDEIKEYSLKHFGAYPQIAVTRKEKVNFSQIEECDFHTEGTKEEYIKNGNSFDSPLFNYTLENFNKKRTEFCYAGKWSFLLNLATGMAKSCYAEGAEKDIFKNINKKIDLQVIGNNCKCLYCMNSSHFMSLGIIPEKYTKSYSDLRNRENAGWYSKRVSDFLNSKLSDTNKEYSKTKKTFSNMKYKINRIKNKVSNKIIRTIKNK